MINAFLFQLQSLSYTIAKQTSLLPPLFVSHEGEVDGDNTVLREWEVESFHDYENNSDVYKVGRLTLHMSFIMIY